MKGHWHRSSYCRPVEEIGSMMIGQSHFECEWWLEIRPTNQIMVNFDGPVKKVLPQDDGQVYLGVSVDVAFFRSGEDLPVLIGPAVIEIEAEYTYEKRSRYSGRAIFEVSEVVMAR